MKFNTKYNFKDYEGKQINYLTPRSESVLRAKDGSKQWTFQCICGKEITTPPYRVISGHIKSCGCMRYKNIEKKINNIPGKKRTNINDYINKRMNRLTVIGVSDLTRKGRVKLKCLCDCGKITYVYPYQFSGGSIQSCGCAREGHTYETESYRKHGMSKDPLYHLWQQIKNRCYNKNAENYERYGGRGITVCDEWLETAENFILWARRTKPKEGNYSIDRIDNDGPYAPWNCRWATTYEQARNKRNTVMINYKGETKCLSDWAKETGINRETLRTRMIHNWPIEKLLTEPVNGKYRHKI